MLLVQVELWAHDELFLITNCFLIIYFESNKKINHQNNSEQADFQRPWYARNALNQNA